MSDQQLSRSQFPPNGWEYHQPQTNWDAPTPKSSTFDQTVILIMKHRQANGAITVRHRLATDVVSIGNELENYTRARLGMPQLGAASPKTIAPPAPALSGHAQVAVAAVKKLAAGAALLMEWDESGMPPVAPEVSESRAQVCATCPKNEKGKSLTEFFTGPAAAMIKKRFERLQQMNLVTTVDEQLNVCQACLCPLRLKCHTPMELILKRLKPEFRAELDPRCWILKA